MVLKIDSAAGCSDREYDGFMNTGMMRGSVSFDFGNEF
jgi:hypothetical protein